LLLLIIFISCRFNPQKEEKSAFERSVPKKEKECLKKINEAKKDISEGNIYFCDNSEWLSIGYRSHEERIELLKKHIEALGVMNVIYLMILFRKSI